MKAAKARIVPAGAGATVLCDAGGRIAEADPGACGLLGRDREGLRSSRLDELAEGADAGTVRRAMEAATSAEATFLRPDGTSVPVALRVRRLCLEGVPSLLVDLSVRRRASESLPEDGEFVRAVLSSADLLVTVLDHQGRIVLVNEACGKLTGYGQEELRGRVLWDVLAAPGERSGFRSAFERTLAGETTRHESDWQGANGRPLRIVSSMSLLAARAGGTPYAIVTGLDLSRQRRMIDRLEALRRVSEVLAHEATLAKAGSRVLQAVGQALGWCVGEVWTIDASGTSLSLLESWREPGSGAEDLVESASESSFAKGQGLAGRVWASGRAVWIPEDRDTSGLERVERARNLGLRGACGFPIFAGNAFLGVMLFFSRRAPEPDPELLEAMQAVAVQIGLLLDRNRAARELRMIVETAPDGIVTVDDTGAIRSFNPAAERLFGYAVGEVLGTPLATLVPGMSGEGRGRRKNGDTFPLSLSVGEGRVGGGRLLTAIVRDLTEAKRREEELVRSRSLAAMGESTAAIVHEIKNPLAAISAPLQVMKESLGVDHPHAEILGEVVREVRRLDDTIRRLLTFARPWTPAKEPCDLRELARRVRCLSTDQDLFQKAPIELEDGAPVLVDADPSQVEQVLWNLVINAAQAMPEGGRIRVGFGEAPGEVVLSVADDGPGMSEEAQARAFQPFFTTKKEGSGLGLPTCRKIMDAHGGRLSLRSRPGSGTTVTLCFPRGGSEARGS